MNLRNAFTVVELVVVIAVIGILATITVVSYSKLQADTRDTERESDIAIIESSLEIYYEKNGRYPSQTELSETFMKSTLSIPASALVAPGASGTNSVQFSTSTSPSAAQYFYRSFQSSGTSCTLSTHTCTKYELRYRKEIGNSIVTVQSKYGW